MPTYQIAPPGEDGTSGNDSLTTMISRYLRTVSPPVSSYGHTRWDLSAYSGTITAARMRLYGVSYTATRGVTKTYSLIWVDHSSTTTQYSLGTYTYSSTGAVWHTLANYDKFKFNNDNIIRIIVGDPGLFKARTFTLRTQEYATSPDTSDPMLEITLSSGETVFATLVG